jgi:lipopolysaccharide export system protein LptA
LYLRHRLHQHERAPLGSDETPSSVARFSGSAPREAPTTVLLAVIESEGKTVFDSFDDLRKELVAQAAELGGEALILGPEFTDSEFIFTGTAMIKSDKRNLTGEVIVYD